MKFRLFGGAVAVSVAALLTSPAVAFEGKSLVAPDCNYGGKIKSIVATDEHTVTFSMCSPDPAFKAKAAFVPFGIQPAKHIEEAGPKKKLLENPIGTGPFKLESWNRGDSITMTRNENYWGAKPAFDKLVFRWNQSGAGRLNELRSGTVDEITNISPDDFDSVKNDPDLQFLPQESPNILYLGMVNTAKPFENEKVRQAIAMGIDRQRIVDNFYPKGSVVASHFTPCSLPNGCAGKDWYGFDASAAKKLLADAGFPNGFKTKIYYRDVFRAYLPEPSVVAVEFQTQLKKNLGIDAEVVPIESGKFIDDTSAGRIDGLYLLGWGADYPHVTNFLDYHFGKTSKMFGTTFPEITEGLTKGGTIADTKQAEPIYAAVNDAIRQHVPMVPIVHGAAAYAARATLKNAIVRPFGSPLLQDEIPGKDTLVFMQNAEPISLYCGDETDGETLNACTPITETLLNYAKDSGDILPGLAKSCDANADSTVWICHLQEGVKFTDGSAFNANDVVVSWAAGLDASNPAHVGNTGSFDYFSSLWGGLMNAKK
ncbi:peptide ABC transporter substrate-binding protein [Agrobacterium vitis]|uniref:Peptide ABC transporter substrate-binding protein n=1 Tax=Agrobacterium vitis TaxID=373 RepID=A0ABD6G9F8_AGRVI|nr:ABC transporter substrate-binding protein [Agrobacterium vitis]MUO80629.1 peptide ABC transporter substrate-binding protein [Agrobacterium vitis]MUO94969.1 peptide ABC transporter substrate-binding protein [Agrobacterium vitis]MUP05239.1 peptide ABC transporter substrate-binding protein [Agrobacterium vitis]MUZ81984.1 peptide ABC transporter substrate-binding protein [Agrobacterium vitis]MVA09717.1 peptide ABC transporter substrate-binding protein [Agrobacterium vitis]